MDEKLIEMRTLLEQLNRASDAYYNGLPEVMTDFEWDAMFDRLKALEEETGVVLPGSPTARVSEDNTVGQKEDHEFAALSLASFINPLTVAITLLSPVSRLRFVFLQTP